jgi:hypothetical protein
MRCGMSGRDVSADSAVHSLLGGRGRLDGRVALATRLPAEDAPEDLHVDRRLEHEEDMVAVVLDRAVAVAAEVKRRRADGAAEPAP